VRVRLGAIDEITLDVSGTVIEQLDVVPAASADEGAEEDDDEVPVGPIAIAVDLDEADAPTVPPSVASADNPRSGS
jgi:exoribonuclease-2